MPLRRNTQEELVAMKKEIINKCVAKELLCKEGAKLLNMHEKAFSRLKRNYLDQGEIALMPQKPGPKQGSPHNKTPEWMEDLVVEVAFAHQDQGPISLVDTLKDEHGILLDQSTIYRILKRKRARYFREYLPIEKRKFKQYCLDLPGEEVQLDGCYPYGRSRKVVAFSAIDDCSRYVLGHCYDRETAINAIGFVTEMVKRAPFRIKAIRVDNRYGRVFKNYCESILRIEVIENDPYCPRQNGKIERYNRTLKHKFFWKYCSFHDDMETLNYKYHNWLNYYNYERKHGGYKMDRMTPAQKLASTLLFETSNTLINYPQKVTGILQQYNSLQIP
jgi:IS30 family transposase